MKNNTARSDARAEDEQVIARAVNRLKKAYLRHVSWRGVAKERGVNVQYVWSLCQRGVVPRKPEVRAALFLPRVMPSERTRKPRRAPVKLGAEGWQEVYFKKVKAKR